MNGGWEDIREDGVRYLKLFVNAHTKIRKLVPNVIYASWR